MAWAARVAATGAALSIVACAAIAGLEDPSPMALTSGDGGESLQDTGTVFPGDGAVPAPGDGDVPASDAASGDGAPDGPPVDPCPLAKLDDACTMASQCCSNKCGERRRCVNSCKNAGSFCDPTSTNECCIGMWCNGQCAACIAANQPAATDPILGVPLSHSCCSRALKTASSECQ